MADETDTTTKADGPTVVETPTAPKKQRKPRVKKAAALEISSADATAEPALAGAETVKRRGRKAKVIEAAPGAKRSRVSRAPKTVQTASLAPTTAIDEMADLLQLEEENQRLRKLLAKKLRAENADLRKRLRLD